MSATDFFLVERAAQIQRLRQSADNPIRVPGRYSRLGYSPRALEFFRALDEIARLRLQDQGKKKWLERWRARVFGQASVESSDSDEQPLLSPAARAAIETFDKHIVPILLDEDETANPIAEAFVGAILRDYQNYFGLKPLQFHSDEFAYEYLFPSWLNLYTALCLPCAATGKPRFSLPQVKAIFSRFQELEEQGGPPDPEWVATMAFLANRLPALVGQDFLQRLFDLRSLTAHGSTATTGTRLGYLQTHVDSAPGLLTLLKSLIILETVVYNAKLVPRPRLVQRLPQLKPIPTFIATQLEEIAKRPDCFSTWAELVVQVARLIENGDGFDREFAEILEVHANASNLRDWLGLLIPADDAPPLSRSGQRILAKLIRRTQSDGEPCHVKVRDYARHIAPRLNALDESATALFEKHFVEHDSNRELMLASVGSTERRKSISQKLVAGAENLTDRKRWLGQLGIAAVLNPDLDAASMAALGRTLKVLSILQEQGFISPNQFQHLTDHLRERLPDSAAILADPMRGVAGNSGPSAMLYLALSEVCMKYELTGIVENFGLTTGAFSNLRRAGE